MLNKIQCLSLNALGLNHVKPNIGYNSYFRGMIPTLAQRKVGRKDILMKLSLCRELSKPTREQNAFHETYDSPISRLIPIDYVYSKLSFATVNSQSKQAVL